VNVPVFTEDGKLPPEVAQHAFDQAQKGGVTAMIIDTAGRSQLDQNLMDELRSIRQRVPTAETLLVVDAMIGQEALHIAEGFRDTVTLTGLILTKMDGDARGGASISIRSVTGVPIKFLGTGEGIDALETYDPSRLRITYSGNGRCSGADRERRKPLTIRKRLKIRPSA
jgi:signal recognition particle subunit SRP54